MNMYRHAKNTSSQVQLADGEAVCLKGMMLGMAASAAARVGDGTSGASGCGMTGAAGVVCDGSVADGAVEGCVEAGAVALGSVFVLWNVQDSLTVDYVAGTGHPFRAPSIITKKCSYCGRCCQTCTQLSWVESKQTGAVKCRDQQI